MLIVRDAKIGTSLEDDLDRELMVRFAAASLYARSSTPLDAAFIEQWHRDPKGGSDAGHLIETKVFPLSLPVRFAPPLRGPIRLESGRELVVRALKAFRSNHPYLRAFHFALARWFYSLNKQRRTLEDAVVDLAIALEAVFILQEERGDKEELLRERLAGFWFETDANASNKRRQSFKWKVYEAYTVRSGIVHDALDSDALDKARNFLDQVIRHLLHDFIAGELKEFNPVRYWRGEQAETCSQPHRGLASA